MQLHLAGVPIVVEPDSGLTPADHASLARLGRSALAQNSPDPAPFQLEIVDDDSWRQAERAAHPDGTAAAVDVVDGQVRVTHRRLFAEIDVQARHARLVRPPTGGLAIDVALRAALCVSLPLYDGLPLHAAGIVVNGHGGVFFGPSGAGKSTLAAACPWTVLSDELVAVFGDPPRVQAAGFWGTHERDGATHEAYPVAALVELAKGERFEMTRLGATTALRRLLGVLLVPPEPELWRRALAVLDRLIHGVPVYRMSWTPTALPWDEVRAILMQDAAST